jgi:predicted outer membrane repeat protein
MKSSELVAVICFSILLFIVGGAQAVQNGTVCEQGGVIFIGEEGLNVTHALNGAYYGFNSGTAVQNNSAPPMTVIGWWESAADIYNTAPSRIIDLSTRYRYMTVAPSDFVGFTGNWYLIDVRYPDYFPYGDNPLVFNVQDPTLDIRIWDYTQHADVTGKSVRQGRMLGFRIDTNMYPATDGRNRSNVIDDSYTGTWPTTVVSSESNALIDDTGVWNNHTVTIPDPRNPCCDEITVENLEFTNYTNSGAWMTWNEGTRGCTHNVSSVMYWNESIRGFVMDSSAGPRYPDFPEAEDLITDPGWTTSDSCGQSSPIGPVDGYIELVIRNESGTRITGLYNASVSEPWNVPGPNSVLKNFVDNQPWFWGSSDALPVHLNAALRPTDGYVWDTGARDSNDQYFYPPGTYTVYAVSQLNNMKDNYQLYGGADYTGRTVTLVYSIILLQNTSVHTLDPGDSIQQNITDAARGDTIILNPGTYYERDIMISKNITIRANASCGGTAANTIIDAALGGRIFDNSAGKSLTVDNLTLRNGYTQGYYPADRGGAIISDTGSLTILFSVITNSSSGNFGGAVSSDTGTLEIISSLFSNNSAASSGGALYTSRGNTSIRGSTFSNCTSGGGGGAIDSDRGEVTIISSTFSDCSAAVFGGAIFSFYDNLTIRFSRIVRCNTPDAIESIHGNVDAENNWWGTNNNPSGYSCPPYVTCSPWLVMNISATPASITASQTSVIKVNITNNSEGTDTTSGGIFIPDGIPIDFTSRWNNYMQLVWWPGTITDGSNMTTFIPRGPGTSWISATVDGQLVSTNLMVTSSATASKIGIFRNGAWYLDYNANGWWDGPVTDLMYPAFGATGDAPVAGDWNNDKISETGVFRNGAWFLDYSGNGWWDGPVTDRKYQAFGTAGDVPVAGNWSGDGTTEIGVFRNGAWFLDKNGNGWWDGPATDIKYPSFGTTGDAPLAGDWNNDGMSEIGVFRNGAWYLDYNGNGWWDGPVTDLKLPAFGTTGDIPVAGDWNNNGISEVGVFRNGAWYLDYSGNGWWDGPVTDLKYPAFGTTGDKPVSGVWN